MKTLVLQSYRETDVPDWMAHCMRSVQAWANGKDWEYRFKGDEFFDLVPNSIGAKFAAQRPLLADIARLKWALQIFEAESAVERVVWLDADVVIFSPMHLSLPEEDDFAVGRQIWVQADLQGKLRVYRQVHNAALMIDRGSPALGFLMQAMTRIAERHDSPASPQLLGPKLLTALHNIVGFAVIEGVGMASPRVLADISDSGGPAYDLLIKESATPIGALNLCSSYRRQSVDGVMCNDLLYEQVLDALLQ